MLDDISKFPEKQTGTYRGIEWIIDRPSRTYLRRYVRLSDDISSEEMKIIENKFHQGIYLVVKNELIGFDCSRKGDYFPVVLDINSVDLHSYFTTFSHDNISYGIISFSSGDECRSLNYVYNILIETINKLVNSRQPISKDYVKV